MAPEVGLVINPAAEAFFCLLKDIQRLTNCIKLTTLNALVELILHQLLKKAITICHYSSIIPSLHFLTHFLTHFKNQGTLENIIIVAFGQRAGRTVVVAILDAAARFCVETKFQGVRAG